MSATAYITPALHTLPVRERPAYRVTHVGARACNLSEILATIIGGQEQIELAQHLLAEFGDIVGLARATPEEIKSIPGLGPAGAARLKAALELGCRLSKADAGDRPQVRSPADAASLLMPEIGHLEQEHFVVLFLDTRNRVIGKDTLYKGSLNASHVRVAEVFREAIRRNCAAILVAHNHPSMDVSASPVIWRIGKSQVYTRPETCAQDDTGQQQRRTLQAACGGRGEGAFFCEKTPPSPHTPFPQRNLVSPPFAERLGGGVVVHGCGYGIHTHQSIAIEVISSEKHLWSSEWMHWSPAASRASGSSFESRSWM